MNQSFLSGLEGMAGTTRLELSPPGRVARTINLDTTLVALPTVLEGGLLILLFLARLASAEPFTPPPIQPPEVRFSRKLFKFRDDRVPVRGRSPGLLLPAAAQAPSARVLPSP